MIEATAVPVRVPVTQEVLEDAPDLSWVWRYAAECAIRELYRSLFRETHEDPMHVLELGVARPRWDALRTYTVEVEEPYVEFGSGGSYGW